MKKLIYLDNAATTKTAPAVVEAMLPYFTEYYGNPSGVYDLAVRSKIAIEESREHIATLIGADKEEIVFTSGGTEADNYALKGCSLMNKSRGRHIITSKIEHHGVLNSCKFLEENGYKVRKSDIINYNNDDTEIIDMLKYDKPFEDGTGKDEYVHSSNINTKEEELVKPVLKNIEINPVFQTILGKGNENVLVF